MARMRFKCGTERPPRRQIEIASFQDGNKPCINLMVPDLLGESSMTRAPLAVALIAILIALLASSGCSRGMVSGAEGSISESGPPPPPPPPWAPGERDGPTLDGPPPPPPPMANGHDVVIVSATSRRVRSIGARRSTASSETAEAMIEAPATDTSRPPEPQKVDYLKGRGAFSKLPELVVGRSYPLMFVVGPTEDALADEAGGVGLATSHMVYVAPVMRVTLLPNTNFDTKAVTSADQRTGPDKSATWQWNILPKRDGEHTLSALVEVRQQNPDGSYTTIESKNRHVSLEVEVGTWQGFMTALQNAASLGDVLTTLFNSWGKTLGALAALIAAIFGVPIAIREGRKRLRG